MAAAETTAAAVLVGERLVNVADLVRRICVSRLGVDDGADAAQEAMLRLWRAVQRPEFRAEGLYGYAAAVARYEVLRTYGRRDRHRHVRLGEAAEHVVADPAPALAERVEQRLDAAAAVADLAARLSPRQRAVLASSLAADWDTDSVAELLSLTPSGVRSSQVRAMAQLRAAAGVASPNPLASPLSESARKQRRRAAAHDQEPIDAGRQEVLFDVAA
ncbi:hypothetical protein Ae717Ps2_6608c [Pseudonocardia sp. Ae717_Ps2]|uniref:RNA polymerase sigma factor n=1 Tax=Pseudonocardia sp. Ae717_Ps2 TaxID=1885573 RepID=UPI00094B2148|nr:sigma-70 family RNA polymerase sigma factor [Pseudonocardia sp. Ae717_Ps2]OLM28269.1 hypothetical protein Ae717Ps2_6608c [Pseudonocardia sp. Ae717_Ps2]